MPSCGFGNRETALAALLWRCSPRKESNVFAEDKVGGVRAGDMFGESVAEFGEIEAGEEWFAGTEQARRDREMEIVNEAIAEELPDG